MFSMRSLLASNPFVPSELRLALSRSDSEARERLLELGVDECVAAELLDQRHELRQHCADSWG